MNPGIVIKQATINDAIKKEPYRSDLLIVDGKIKRLAPILNGKEINDANIIDGEGLFVYPGFVEAHCHIGMDGYGLGVNEVDFNELTDSITPQLSAIDAINPRDPTFRMALESGVTCVATGPGSSNVLGGVFIAIKTVGSRIDDMVIKKDVAMKCSFGENPKKCYREKDNFSRMSTASKIRTMLEKTKDYARRKEAARDDILSAPEYDEKLEALIPVIMGKLPLKAHAHRADDIFTAIRIAKEFNLKLAIDHCTDGSLIAKELAQEGYPLAVGPSMGHPSKPELVNASFTTPGILVNAGCKVSIITDSPVVQQHYLALCAGLAIKSGMSEFDALKAITINAAAHIGLEDRIGSIEEGKDADLVITNGSPFKSDTVINTVIVDGVIQFRQ
jgi:imidazolonepropionase-like amidohydrolase